MNEKEILELRLINNGLVNKYRDSSELVSNLLGIQCQYQNYALISIFNRLNNTNINNIFKNDDLIKSWGQRATLHIYNKNDYCMISDLYNGSPNWVDKYIKELNIDINYVLDVVKEEISKKNLSKSDIEKIIEPICGTKIMTWSGLLILATYKKILYGLLNKNDYKLYKINDIDNNYDEGKFILNYFKYYGPATIDDFVHYSGLRVKDLNKYFKYLDKLDSFNFKGKKYYYEKHEDKKVNYPIVLGKFDPLLVCYKDKSWLGVDSRLIWMDAGQIEGVIINRNGVCGTWHYNVSGKKVKYLVKVLNNISETDKKKIINKFARYKKILDKDLFEVIWR